MQRRKFIKTIAAASAAIAAPIAVIPKNNPFLDNPSGAGLVYAKEYTASEFLLTKPSISDAIFAEMQERTIIDLMESAGIPKKYLDNYKWND